MHRADTEFVKKQADSPIVAGRALAGPLTGVLPATHPRPAVPPVVFDQIDLPRHSPVARFIKRSMDIILVLVGGMLISPLLVLLAIIVKTTSPGPIFYGQKRIGRHGRSFKCWKFRTMIPNADIALKDHLAANSAAREEWARDHKLRNDPRITTIGRFLRKTSLDELPQLWNVMVGEMSLVGPRPIVTAEIEKYGDCFPLYASVQPGITGLWQVSGRNDTTYERRVSLDRSYVREWSLWADASILFRTVSALLRSNGAC